MERNELREVTVCFTLERGTISSTVCLIMKEASGFEDMDLAIIVYSCFKNRDMWAIFSKLFRKYWWDCPYKVVLVTDQYQDLENDYVFSSVIQKDGTWGEMIKEAIKQIKTPYVMLWMDDYLLCDYVSNKEVMRQLERARRYHAANLRLIESPKCYNILKGNTAVGYYKQGNAYSLSTQIGIWDAKWLLSVVKNEWSAWDFERIGSLKKSNFSDCLLVALDYVFPYEEGVRQGKWMEAGVKLCKRNGIVLDLSIRPIMSNREMARMYIKSAILDWNSTLIVRIQNFFLKLIKNR